MWYNTTDGNLVNKWNLLTCKQPFLYNTVLISMISHMNTGIYKQSVWIVSYANFVNKDE